MEIGINLFDTNSIPLEEQLDCIVENGFRSVFFGSDEESPMHIARELDRRGLRCESLHAPFDHINDMWVEGENGERMLKELTDGVALCASIGTPVLVVHLSSGDNAPTVNDIGLARYTRLMNYAKEKGITVAYENQRKLGRL